jgi:hypothetical protein
LEADVASETDLVSEADVASEADMAWEADMLVDFTIAPAVAGSMATDKAIRRANMVRPTLMRPSSCGNIGRSRNQVMIASATRYYQHVNRLDFGPP